MIWLIVLLLTDKCHICTNLFMFDFLQFLFISSGKCPNCIIYPLLILKSLIYIYYTDLTSICHIQFFQKKRLFILCLCNSFFFYHIHMYTISVLLFFVKKCQICFYTVPEMYSIAFPFYSMIQFTFTMHL